MKPRTPGSDFELIPDPPVEGGDVEVVYTGPEETVFFGIVGRGASPVRFPKGKPKRFKIPAASLWDGAILFVTTKTGTPGFIARRVARRGA